MRLIAVTCLALAALLPSTASAALHTDSLDDLRAKIAERDAALPVDLTKEQAKLKKSIVKLLATIDGAASTTLAGDAKIIATVGKGVAKAFVGDAEVLGLFDAAMDAFMAEVERVNTLSAKAARSCDDGYAGKAALEGAADVNQGIIDAYEGATDPKIRSKQMGTAVKSLAKLRANLVKAAEGDAITGHAKRLAVDSDQGYVGAATCLACHTSEAEDLIESGHWNWEGVSANIRGHESHVHGKQDLINNFCIAIPSNEGRCTQCHPSVGWANKMFDLDSTAKIDCLVCHDTTGSYQKSQTAAGAPEATVDLDLVSMSVGSPSRANCGDCHFYAGGGDNVKHPDLYSTMVSTTRTVDVHMGTDGGDMSCQECHVSTGHGIAGMSLHSIDEGAVACTDCHTGTIHTGGAALYENHLDKIACQTCHIPTFARDLPTKMEWYWSEAGQDVSPIPTDPVTGKPLYDKKKGRFVWGRNVTPELMWFNGKWDRVMIGENDQYTSLPAVLAAPVGSLGDGVSKIYPFKKMIGKQPADAVNRTILVPHLFGTGPGPNPYWAKYNWGPALSEGAAYAGQTYSGSYEFVDTVMYLSVNHEIAPKTQARTCTSCHFGGIDFTKLGYAGDPMLVPAK